MFEFEDIKEIESSNSNQEIEVDVSKITPNLDQPRKDFDVAKQKELAASIKQHGLINAIVVVKRDNGFMIVSGERRFLATVDAGFSTIRCRIVDLDELAIMEIALIENTDRENLTPFEEAHQILKIWKTGFAIGKYKNKGDLSNYLQKDETWLSKRLGVFNLPDGILESLVSEKKNVSIDVLYDLARIEDKVLQRELFDSNAGRDQVREAIKTQKESKKDTSSPQEQPRAMKSFTFRETDDIQDILSAIQDCGSCVITVKEIVEVKQNNGSMTEEK